MRSQFSDLQAQLKAMELRRRLGIVHATGLQPCEPRLVLSAQLLMDVVDPWQIQHHGILGSQYASHTDIALPHTDVGSAEGIEPHSSSAHQQTGWNAVQQEFGLKGTGQTVAVIDSGIAWDHTALGKGFGAGYRVVGGWDFAENDSNPYDDGPTGFHGTHVAGIIGSDSSHTPGVATDVDLVGLRVFDDSGKGDIQWVEQALAWVHNNRNAFANPITTVNLSLGSTWNSSTVPGWATLEDELRQLYNDGIVVTASAGNAFKQYNAPGLSYPAASPYVLPVASVDDNGSLSDFSQRNERVLAAPGRNILSTVPDHVLGRDGKVNDFSTATGTSMASPYVAGASVLVREAMEMVGTQNITPSHIFDWLHQTADKVYDSITKASYDRLNLQQAIDNLLPDDTVGDIATNAQAVSLSNQRLDGWVNHLGDVDVYRFTAGQSGRLTLDGNSDWLDSMQWSVTSNGHSVAAGSLDSQSLAVTAGQTYELRVAANQEIGPFQFQLAFQADQTPLISPDPNPQPGPSVDLGRIDLLSRDVAAGSTYHAVARHDGLFTVEWSNPDAPMGSLLVRDSAGTSHVDATWSDGKLRLDLPVNAGQAFDIVLPGAKSDNGSLTLVDLVQLKGNELLVRDTAGADVVGLDLSRGVRLAIDDIQYDFSSTAISRINIDGTANSDTLNVVGSALADKVEMKLGSFTLENTQLLVTARQMEMVNFDSGLGVEDRLAMFDSDGDDTLTVRSDSAELTGIGYRFTVQNMDKYVINGTGQGEDIAYMYDSAGDDHLSVRPQFTSLSSNNYFVSARGFERVFVYASSGGFDTADLYDSVGDDRFATSGDSASIIGPGFHTSTKYFEQVLAHATAGGNDVAQLYGSSGQTQWHRGSDFVSFSEGTWNRNAQGFERTEAFAGGVPQSIPDASALTRQAVVDFASVSAAEVEAVAPTAAPMVELTSNQFSVDVFVQYATLPVVVQEPVALEPMADRSEDMASQLLLEAMDLQNQTRAACAADELQFHHDPQSERELLDQIFSDLS